MLNAGLTDVFISSEMTTTFPEDSCNIHSTIANIRPDQFVEANRLRHFSGKSGDTRISPPESGGVARSAGVVPKRILWGCRFGTTPRGIRFAIPLPF